MISRVLTICPVALRLIPPAGIHTVPSIAVFSKEVPGILILLENEDRSRSIGTRSKIIVKVSVHSSIIQNQAESTRDFS
jgi:hypothetical protein